MQRLRRRSSNSTTHFRAKQTISWRCEYPTDADKVLCSVPHMCREGAVLRRLLRRSRWWWHVAGKCPAWAVVCGECLYWRNAAFTCDCSGFQACVLDQLTARYQFGEVIVKVYKKVLYLYSGVRFGNRLTAQFYGKCFWTYASLNEKQRTWVHFFENHLIQINMWRVRTARWWCCFQFAQKNYANKIYTTSFIHKNSKK